MKFTLLLGAAALAGSVAAGPAFAAGDSAKRGMQQQGASAGASTSQMQHDQSTVRQAQERLNQLGYEAGQPDGMWGPKTRAALRKYQEEQGMTPSGELDSRTIAQLGLDSVGGSGTAAGASSSPPAAPGSTGAGSMSPGRSGGAAGAGSTSPSAPGAESERDKSQ